MAKKERRIYDPHTAPQWTPAKEWVELVDGSEVCVWELSVPDQFQVAEAAQRHPSDPRPGGDDKEAAVWLIAYAARKGEEPGSPRVFGDLEIVHILNLDPENFARLLQAARGLVQHSEAEEEKLRDFTSEAGTGKPVSSTGASSISTDSHGSLTKPECVGSGAR